MKTFLEFLYEAEGSGEHSKRIAELRRLADRAMRSGDMQAYARYAEELKQEQSSEKLGRHLRGDEPNQPEGRRIPGRGQSPQKPRDVITGKTTIGTIANVDRPGTVSSGEIVAQANVGTRSQKGGSVPLRNKARNRMGGTLGTKGPN